MENIVHSSLPLWACLASLLAVPAILLFRKELLLREGATFVAGFVKLAIVCLMVPTILDGKLIEFTLAKGIAGLNVPIVFRVDGLGILFALVASALWIPTSLYAIGYMRGLHEHSQTRFFAFFALSLSATLGVAFSGNLLTMYLFYEVLSLSTWPLVTHHQDKEARTGGRVYLTHLLTTSIGFALPALIFCYLRSGGTMEFSLEGFLAGNLTKTESIVILLLFTFGFAKNGLMPFHSWLPNAMVAPTPVSALLHAVAVVKVGVFCVIRVFTGVFGLEMLRDMDIGIIVSWIAAFTVIASSLIALSQDNLKRRLAFSTIGQLAYIILGISLLTDWGAKGSMLHIVMHACGKITLFFCAGAIFVATGKKYISQMTGLGWKMPITFGCFLIACFSVTGLPPTGGFVSKFSLVLGTVSGEGGIQGRDIALLSVFLISTILNAAYFFPIAIKAFFPPSSESGSAKFSFQNIKEAPLACVLPIVVTTSLTVYFFFGSAGVTALVEQFLNLAKS